MSVNVASRILIDVWRVTVHILASLIDDSRSIIFYCKIFIEKCKDSKCLQITGMQDRYSIVEITEKKFHKTESVIVLCFQQAL